MITKSWKVLRFIIPAVILSLMFYYLAAIVRQYEQKTYETTKKNTIEATSIFAHNIDGLVQDGFTWDEHRDLYNNMIFWYIETVSVNDYVYIAIFDLGFNEYEDILGTQRFECVGTFDLFEYDGNRSVIYNAITMSNTGSVELVVGGKQQELYFQAIPLDNTKYWIFVGVNRERVLQSFDFSLLINPILIIGLLFTLSIMDSVWQRVKQIRKK